MSHLNLQTFSFPSPTSKTHLPQKIQVETKKNSKKSKNSKKLYKKKNSKVLEFLLNFLPNDCTFTKTPNTHFCEMEVS